MMMLETRVHFAFARQPEERKVAFLYTLQHHSYPHVQIVNLNHGPLTDLAKAPFAPAPPPRAFRGMSGYEVSSEGSALI